MKRTGNKSRRRSFNQKTEKAIRAVIEQLELRRLLSYSYIVSNLGDDVNTPHTLRWAVSQANSQSSDQEIGFDPTLTENGPVTIDLINGPLELDEPSPYTLTIQGLGANSVTIDGSILNDAGTTSVISGLTIHDGGVSNHGDLTLVNSVISGGTGVVNGERYYHHGYGSGGGYGTGQGYTRYEPGAYASGYGPGYNPPNYSDASLTITDSTITGNDVQWQNGAGLCNLGGDVYIDGSTISDNSVTYEGSAGGIFNKGGLMTITESLITGNDSSTPFGYYAGGGGILNTGTLSVSQSTISNNYGGGIVNQGYAHTTIDSSTISGNEGTYAAVSDSLSPYLTISNSLITDNRDTGIFIFSNGWYESAIHFSITNCTISDNENGGISLSEATATITDSNITANANSGITLFNSTAALSGCTLSANSAYYGGGIDVEYGGTASISDCVLSDNSSTLGGGGIENAGTININNSWLYNNSSPGGGAIETLQTATITNSTINNNSAIYQGGAIRQAGSLTLSNTTITGNTAPSGGALYAQDGTINFTDCTVVGNSATTNNGGGLRRRDSGNLASITLSGSIVAQNIGGDLVGGGFSGTYNLIGDGSGGLSSLFSARNILGSDTSPINPLLLPLGNYGGPTQTMALLPNSPALNAGATFDGPNGVITTDQRGANRPYGAAPDIGAFEGNGPILYYNDFSTDVNPSNYPDATWEIDNPDSTQPNGVSLVTLNDSYLDTTVENQRQFLGQFANDTVSLALTNLPTHTGLTLSFDVFVLRTLDGNAGPGADQFQVSYDGGGSLFATTFSDEFENNHQQSYPEQDYTSGGLNGGESFENNNAPQTGATETNTLLQFAAGGSTIWYASSVYHFVIPISNQTASSIKFNFSQFGLQVPDDESWGLDNVVVSAGAESVPTVALSLNPSDNPDLPADTANNSVPTPVPVSPAGATDYLPATLTFQGSPNSDGTGVLAWDESTDLQIWENNGNGTYTQLHNGEAIPIVLNGSGSETISLELLATASEDFSIPISATFTPTGSYQVATDTALARPYNVDLTVDSFNTLGAGTEQVNGTEDAAENNPLLPGKLLPVTSVPWITGSNGEFNVSQDYRDDTPTGNMAALTLEWNPSIDTGSTVTFNYAGADPSNPISAGYERIWLDNGQNGGFTMFYIQPGTAYPLTDFFRTVNGTPTQWQMFIEGVSPTSVFSDEEITATLHDSANVFLGSDTVHVTVVDGISFLPGGEVYPSTTADFPNGPITLNWYDDTDPNVVKYLIYRSSNKIDANDGEGGDSIANIRYDDQDTSLIGETAPFDPTDVNPDQYLDYNVRFDNVYYYRISEVKQVPGTDLTYATTPTSQWAEIDTAQNPSSLLKPTDLVATSTSDGNDITWANPNTNHADDGVVIERSADGQHWQQIYQVGSGLTSYLDPTHQEYYYRVRFVGGDVRSDFSNYDEAPFHIPTDITEIDATSTSITLQWDPDYAEYGRDGFEIYRSTDSNFTASSASLIDDSPANEFTDTGLSPGTTYYYIIKGYGFDGVESFPSQTAFADTTAQAPSNLLAADSHSTSIDLTWDASPSSNVAGYYVYYSTSSLVSLNSSNRFDGLMSVDWTTVTGLTPNTEYYFVITAVNQEGFESDPSNEASRLTAPAAPTSVAQVIADTTTSSITIDWTAPAGADGYWIYRNGSGPINATLWTGLSYTDSGLDSSMTYDYQVGADSSVGQSDESTEAAASTVPDAPTDLVATSVQATRIDLQWSGPSQDSFRIYRGTSPSFALNSSSLIRDNWIGGPFFSDTSVPAVGTFYYVVVAEYAGFDSVGGSPASANTGDIAVPSGPPNLTANAVSSSEIDLAWYSSAYTDHYVVYRWVDSEDESTRQQIYSGQATSYQDTSLAENTKYDYVVVAVNGGGPSADSPSASATTPYNITIGAFTDWVDSTDGQEIYDDSGLYNVPYTDSNGSLNAVYVQPWLDEDNPYTWGVDYDATVQANGSVNATFATYGSYLLRIIRQNNVGGTLNSITEYVEIDENVTYDEDNDPSSKDALQPASLPELPDLVVLDTTMDAQHISAWNTYFTSIGVTNIYGDTNLNDAASDIVDDTFFDGPDNVFIIGHGQAGYQLFGANQFVVSGDYLSMSTINGVNTTEDFIDNLNDGEAYLNNLVLFGCQTASGTGGPALLNALSSGLGVPVAAFRSTVGLYRDAGGSWQFGLSGFGILWSSPGSPA